MSGGAAVGTATLESCGGAGAARRRNAVAQEWQIRGGCGLGQLAVTLYGGPPVIEKETEKRIQKPHVYY